MKKIFLMFCVGFTTLQMQALGDVQRLLILNVGKVVAQKGVVKIDAYCTDIFRDPPLNQNLKCVYFGGEKTMVNYLKNGIPQRPINLNAALAQNIVTILGDSYINESSSDLDFNIIIKAGKKGIIIKDINTQGLWVGKDDEQGVLTMDYIRGDPYNRNGRQQMQERMDSISKKLVTLAETTNDLAVNPITEAINSSKAQLKFSNMELKKEVQFQQKKLNIIFKDGNMPSPK